MFTPVDSLVFGGNFLHAFDIPGQFAIYALERRLKVLKNSIACVPPRLRAVCSDEQVPIKYRFPLYEQLMWCVHLFGHPS